MDTIAIPGAMIVIGSHSRVIFERTVGFRDVAAGDPLRPDAIWRIYSMTKPIVTAPAMVLAEAGLLCCGQPVAEFIPSFARLRVADGAGRDVPARTPPTIQDLMRRTAGVTLRLTGSASIRVAGAEGIIRACSKSAPARPYIGRFSVFSRLICPSV